MFNKVEEVTLYNFDLYQFDKDYNELFSDMFETSNLDDYECRRITDNIMAKRMNKYQSITKIKLNK